MAAEPSKTPGVRPLVSQPRRAVGRGGCREAAQNGRPDQVVVQNSADGDHFDPNYFARGQQWNLPNLKGSEEGYKIAKAIFEKANRKIYDATVGGHLTVFEKVDYHDVFGNTSNSRLRPCLVGG